MHSSNCAKINFWESKNFEFCKKLNDFIPSWRDVPQVAAAWKFFISFPGCIQAIVPKKFLGIDDLWILQEIKRFHSLFRGCSSGRCSLEILYIIISASSTCQRARITRRGDESDVVSCISFSTRHATTERIFLIIDNFHIFHLNNLKLSVKLLYIHMNNFPTESFLSVKLTQTVFVAKVRKKRTMARIDFLLNIYKQSTV